MQLHLLYKQINTEPIPKEKLAVMGKRKGKTGRHRVIKGVFLKIWLFCLMFKINEMRPYLELIRWGDLKMVGRGVWTSSWRTANVSVWTEVLVCYCKNKGVKDEHFLLSVKKNGMEWNGNVREGYYFFCLFYYLLLSLFSD